MPVALSVVFVIAGVCLWTGSLLIASRANHGVRMPFWKNPPNNRDLAIAYRALGGGLIAFGASILAAHLDHWGIAPLLIFVLLSLPLLIIPIHNHHVTTEHAAELS